MAETQQAKGEAETATAETSEFASLLQKQFKPQTDRARDECHQIVAGRMDQFASFGQELVGQFVHQSAFAGR